jgi:hypothetical protein
MSDLSSSTAPSARSSNNVVRQKRKTPHDGTDPDTEPDSDQNIPKQKPSKRTRLNETAGSQEQHDKDDIMSDAPGAATSAPAAGPISLTTLAFGGASSGMFANMMLTSNN